MARRSQYPLVDRIVGGQLGSMLAAWRADGLSFPDIALRLHDDHGIDVSNETVRRWVRDLGPVPAGEGVA